MIYGIGTDIIEIGRISAAVGRHGERFLGRIFTEAERLGAGGRVDEARFYALRWAAKEAAWKALSPGYRRGVGWQDLEVISDSDGRPHLRFHGEAERYFAEETGGRGKTSLSLSDDGGMALAFVVLSAS